MDSTVGFFIIYFFDKISNWESVTNIIDIMDYRRGLKNILINSSDDMSQKCLFCGNNAYPSSSTAKCSSCHRINHVKCVVSQTNPVNDSF